MVGRSGDLRGITQPHWVALDGLIGNTRMTPYAQKRREAGRPVWADMALDGRFLLRRLTRAGRPSEPTQQEEAVQRHVGPHRPACLPPFLCIRGHSGVATQCGRAMPRTSPDLPTMSIHLPASLATPEQSTSCAATVLSGQKPVPMLFLRIVIQCH